MPKDQEGNNVPLPAEFKRLDQLSQQMMQHVEKFVYGSNADDEKAFAKELAKFKQLEKQWMATFNRIKWNDWQGSDGYQKWPLTAAQGLYKSDVIPHMKRLSGARNAAEYVKFGKKFAGNIEEYAENMTYNAEDYVYLKSRRKKKKMFGAWELEEKNIEEELDDRDLVAFRRLDRGVNDTIKSLNEARSKLNSLATTNFRFGDPSVEGFYTGEFKPTVKDYADEITRLSKGLLKMMSMFEG